MLFQLQCLFFVLVLRYSFVLISPAYSNTASFSLLLSLFKLFDLYYLVFNFSVSVEFWLFLFSQFFGDYSKVFSIHYFLFTENQHMNNPMECEIFNIVLISKTTPLSDLLLYVTIKISTIYVFCVNCQSNNLKGRIISC